MSCISSQAKRGIVVPTILSRMIGGGLLAVVMVFALASAAEGTGPDLDSAASAVSGPFVSETARPVLSAPLRTVASTYPIDISRAKGAGREVNVRRMPPRVKSAGAAPTGQADTLVKSGTGATPALQFDFAGIDMATAGAVYPPDTVGDVGPNHYVQMVNGDDGAVVRVFDKSGTPLAAAFKLKSMWSDGTPGKTGLGDGIVLYDSIADRWILSQFSFVDPYTAPWYMSIAVSVTGDPTGSYWMYDFSMAAFPDYPKLSVWPDGYYLSSNDFASTWGVDAVAFDRSQMLVGGATSYVRFRVNRNFLLPSDFDGATVPPAGSPNYYYTMMDDVFWPGEGYPGSDRLEIWNFHVDFATPSNSTFVYTTGLSTTPFNYDVGGTSNEVIPQPGTTRQLDAIGEWPMFAWHYRNFGTHESMVGNFTVDANGAGLAGIRWFELRKSGSDGWSIYQEGTHAPDSNHRWMGSIAMDGAGNIALGYSVSSATVYPSIRYATRTPLDALGTLRAEATLIDGTASQTSFYRWGDYSAMAVDPSDDRSFWYTNEYLTATNQWYTRVGVFEATGEPPLNDVCSNAVALSLDTITPGTTIWATGTDLTPCSTSDTKDVWYTFTAPADGVSVVSLCDSSTFDTSLAVLDGCDGTVLACNDDYCGIASQLKIPVVTGTTYYVRVAGFMGAEGDFSLRVDSPTPPANDDCLNAESIAAGELIYGTNLGATGASSSSCGANDTADVWYAFTASVTGIGTANTCDFVGLDTTLSVYDGCSGSELGCNDDYCGFRSLVKFPIVVGTTYLLRVAGYGGGMGNFSIYLTEGAGEGALVGTIDSMGLDDAHPATLGGALVEVFEGSTSIIAMTTTSNGRYAFSFVPSGPYTVKVTAPWHNSGEATEVLVVPGSVTVQNFSLRMMGADDCSNPPYLFEGEIRSGSSAGATGTDISLCGTNDSADVWFRYIPSATGTATFSLCQSAYDTTLSIFDNCGGTQLACNDDNALCGTGAENRSFLTLAVTQSTIYFVRISGYEGATGTYGIQVTLEAAEGEGSGEGEGQPEGEGAGEGEGQPEGENPAKTCPLSSVFSQPLNDGSGGFVEFTFGSEAYPHILENFAVPGGMIESVVWWGATTDLMGAPCTRAEETFRLFFYEDASGEPGALAAEVPITAYREYSGIYYPMFVDTPIYRYTANLPESVALTKGWIAITSANDAGCIFVRATSLVGDNLSSIDDGVSFSSTNKNLSLCLITGSDGCAGNVLVTQNTDLFTIKPGASVRCASTSGHTDNHFIRRFDLSGRVPAGEDFAVSCVRFAIESSTGGPQPIEVNLYSISKRSELTFGNLTLIGTTTESSLPDLIMDFVDVPVSGILTNPIDNDLAVEIFLPDGQAENRIINLGANAAGQSDPTYFAASDCSVPELVDIATIGFPDMHLLMLVKGNSTGNEGEGQAEGVVEGEGQAEGVVEGEGQAEGVVEGEGQAEGVVEGEGQAEGVVEGEGQAEGVVEGEGQAEGVVEGEGQAEGVVEGEGQAEGVMEGEGQAEGVVEGEGQTEGVVEGEGQGPMVHTADQNADYKISLTELLRVIQFFNLRGYYCVTAPTTSEDGYLPGTGADYSCASHDSDYNPQDWKISLTELLRLIQFFNLRGYHPCPGTGTEDDFCPGP